MVLQRLDEARVPEHEGRLLVCLAAMLEALDPALIRPHWQQLLPWAVAALQPVGRARPDLQPALFTSLQDALSEPYGALLCALRRGITEVIIISRYGNQKICKAKIEMEMSGDNPLTLNQMAAYLC